MQNTNPGNGPTNERPEFEHTSTTMASSLHFGDGDTAPTYTIPSRRLGALEHPMIIKNLDKGIKTFGQNNAFQAVCLPLCLDKIAGKFTNID
jgi:hypothetical protein